MLKKRFDDILTEGRGRQLLWLLVFTCVCISVAIVIACYFFDDSKFYWQDVVALFLDPGVFGGVSDKGHDGFRLLMSSLGILLLSALLVSIFTNIFENISDSVRRGNRRYRLKDHIVIIGSGHLLPALLSALKDKGKFVVVMTEQTTDDLSGFIYYHGSRTKKKDLEDARVQFANTIYIIGNDNEENHDFQSLQALKLIEELCAGSTHDIHCFMTVNERTTTEVFQYLNFNQSLRHLLVDVVYDYEYEAEQLLVNTNVLPVIKEDDDRNLEILIIGKGPMSQAIAYECAHICHYPNFATMKKKTRITYIAEDMQRWMDDCLSSLPALYCLSVVLPLFRPAMPSA